MTSSDTPPRPLHGPGGDRLSRKDMRTIPPHLMLPLIQQHTEQALGNPANISLQDVQRLHAQGAPLTSLPLHPAALAVFVKRIQEEEREKEEPHLAPDTDLKSLGLDGVTPRQVAHILSSQKASVPVTAAPRAQDGHAVSLTVDSNRYLVLNWSNPQSYEYYDYIALFDGDPSQAGALGYLTSQWQWASKATSGSYTTGTKRNTMRTYWIAYIRYDYAARAYVVSATGSLPYSGTLTLAGTYGEDITASWTSASPPDTYDWVGLYDNTSGRSEGNYIQYQWATNVKEVSSRYSWDTGHTNGASLPLTAVYWVWSYSVKKYLDMASSGALPVQARTCELLTWKSSTRSLTGFLYLLTWSPSQYAEKYDWVGLWDHEPVSPDDYLTSQWCWAVDVPTGSFQTITDVDLSKTYWIAYCAYSYTEKAYTLLWKAPFMSHPHWMADLAPAIQGKKLREIVLPASHNSATYGITASSSYSPDLPVKYQWEIAKPVVSVWAKTQIMNVDQQLNAGYRCFDLRVAKWDNELWVYHGMYSVQLSDVLTAVRSFSVRNPKEIILLVLSHFQGMNSGDETNLLNVLKSTFGSTLAQNSLGLNATVQDFWSANTPVVIITDGDLTDPVLWKQSSTVEVPYDENNFHSADDVIAWLKSNVIPKTYDTFWVLSLILTTDWQRVVMELLTPGGGLASWTYDTAVSKFTDFFQSQSRSMNIIAVDYVNFYPLVTWAINKNGE